MHDEPRHEAELERLAQLLHRLEPVPSRLDRDQLMFAAGRAQARAQAGAPRPSTEGPAGKVPSRVGPPQMVNYWRRLAALAATLALFFAGLYTAEVCRSARLPDQSLAAEPSASRTVVLKRTSPSRQVATAEPYPGPVTPVFPPAIRWSRDPVAAYLALPGIKIRGGLDRPAGSVAEARRTPRPQTAHELLHELLNVETRGRMET